MEYDSKERASRKARLGRTRGARAEKTDVPGFPEIIARHLQCRVCQLVDVCPELLHQIHTRRLGGASTKTLAKETRAFFESRGETPLDHQCFARHFKGHAMVDAFDDDNDDDFDFLPEPPPLASDAPPPAAPVTAAVAPIALVAVPPPATVLTLPMVKRDNDEDDEEGDATDFTDLVDLIARLKKRVHEVDKDAKFVDDAGAVDAATIILWTRLCGEFVRAMESLNRAKNSNRILRLLVKAHTKRVLQISSETLTSRLNTLIQLLEAGQQGDPSAFRRRVATETREVLNQAAGAAIKESFTRFKLH